MKLCPITPASTRWPSIEKKITMASIDSSADTTSEEVPFSGSFITAIEKPTWLDTR